LGPWVVPPPFQSAERMEPTRARPVPFCFQSLRPEPDFPLVLGLGGAGAALGQVVADGFPDQVLVDVFKLEDFGQQVDGADLGLFRGSRRGAERLPSYASCLITT
jgi:hypothetical protein